MMMEKGKLRTEGEHLRLEADCCRGVQLKLFSQANLIISVDLFRRLCGELLMSLGFFRILI